MKSLRVFLCLLVAGALMTACQKENVEEFTTTKSELESNSTNPNNVSIEYTNLEGLNAIFVENGLTPVTLEDIGISQEEYDKAQAELNDPNIARSRCSGALVIQYMDVNDSGALTTFDILRARQYILGHPQAWFNGITQDEYDDFGYANVYWPRPNDNQGFPQNPSSDLTVSDIIVAYKVILNIYMCQ